MSKIVLAIVVIFIMMTTGMLASAAAEAKEAAQQANGGAIEAATVSNTAMTSSDATKGAANGAAAVTPGKVAVKTEAGKEALIRAWGSYGPVSVSAGYNNYRRIYFPGSFVGIPNMQVTTVVPNSLSGRGAIYSVGVDNGYTYPNRFDARLTVHTNGLSGAYISWLATKG